MQEREPRRARDKRFQRCVHVNEREAWRCWGEWVRAGHERHRMQRGRKPLRRKVGTERHVLSTRVSQSLPNARAPAAGRAHNATDDGTRTGAVDGALAPIRFCFLGGGWSDAESVRFAPESIGCDASEESAVVGRAPAYVEVYCALSYRGRGVAPPACATTHPAGRQKYCALRGLLPHHHAGGGGRGGRRDHSKARRQVQHIHRIHRRGGGRGLCLREGLPAPQHAAVQGLPPLPGRDLAALRGPDFVDVCCGTGSRPMVALQFFRRAPRRPPSPCMPFQ